MLKYIVGLGASTLIAIYRLTHGRIGGRIFGMRLLLLTTKGWKSGRRRTAIWPYFTEKSAYIIVVYRMDDGTFPGWYRNILEEPKVMVQVPGRCFSAVALVENENHSVKGWRHLHHQAPKYAMYVQSQRDVRLIRLRSSEPVLLPQQSRS